MSPFFLQEKCHRFPQNSMSPFFLQISPRSHECHRFISFCKKNGDICKKNGDICKNNGDICKNNGDNQFCHRFGIQPKNRLFCPF